MLTVGDIQYEPQQPKIRLLTTSIVILPAGDFALHPEIFQNVSQVVRERIANDPNNWWDVRDVAELFAVYYGVLKRRELRLPFLLL